MPSKKAKEDSSEKKEDKKKGKAEEEGGEESEEEEHEPKEEERKIYPPGIDGERGRISDAAKKHGCLEQLQEAVQCMQKLAPGEQSNFSKCHQQVLSPVLTIVYTA